MTTRCCFQSFDGGAAKSYITRRLGEAERKGRGVNMDNDDLITERERQAVLYLILCAMGSQCSYVRRGQLACHFYESTRFKDEFDRHEEIIVPTICQPDIWGH